MNVKFHKNCEKTGKILKISCVREDTFLLGGGGGDGPGLRMGSGSLVKFLQIGEGQTCFILNRGRVTVFLARKKITPSRFYFVYIQAKLPVKINLNSGLLIFRAVAESRNSGKSAKSREIHKNTQNTSKFGRNLIKYMSVQQF